MGLPEETLEPLATCSFSITPASVDGTSMVAFSVSSVSSGASTCTLSPGLTSTSMTATSLKSPRSGTKISFKAKTIPLGSAVERIGLVGIDAEGYHRLDHGLAVDPLGIRERLERRQCNEVPIDFEMLT
jgi:hypothetical protein